MRGATAVENPPTSGRVLDCFANAGSARVATCSYSDLYQLMRDHGETSFFSAIPVPRFRKILRAELRARGEQP